MEIKPTTPVNSPVNTPINTPVNEQPKAVQETAFSGSPTVNPSTAKPMDADASKTAPISTDKNDGAPAAAPSSFKR